MRRTEYDDAGRLVLDASWDTSTYTATDASGNVVETRPVTPDEAAEATEDQDDTNAATIRTGLVTAFQNNQTYLGLASPTNAQVVAQVKALTRQMDGIIRIVAGLLDSSST